MPPSWGDSRSDGVPPGRFSARCHLLTLIQPAKLNNVDPQSWPADLLARIANHKNGGWRPLSELGRAHPPERVKKSCRHPGPLRHNPMRGSAEQPFPPYPIVIA